MATNVNVIPFPKREDEAPPPFPIYGNRSRVKNCLLVYGSGINRTFAAGTEPRPDAMFTVPPGSDGLIWANLDGYCIAPMSVAWAAAPLPAFRFMLRRYWRRWLGLPSSPLGERCPPCYAAAGQGACASH